MEEAKPALSYTVSGEIRDQYDGTMACRLDARELRGVDLQTQVYALMLLSYNLSAQAWQVALESDSLGLYYEVARDIHEQHPPLETSE